MSKSPSAVILIVDDEPDNFDVIDTFLHGEDVQLYYASSAPRAIAQLPEIQPDVILMDVMMPQMSGIEACKVIKADPQWQGIPIIMVTALTAKDDLSLCLSSGADDFISKPVNGTELRARVSSMLRIRRQYTNVQALLRLREDMANMIVHDLRVPLSSIMLSADMLQSMEMSPAKQQRKAEQILLAARQLQALIDDLLITARIENGQMSLERQTVDLHDLSQVALQDFDAIAQQRALSLVADLPAQSCAIEVDGTLLRRVIDNLLSNALKFSPRGGQITLRVRCETAGVRIQVADQGKGVRDDLRQRIFERYETGLAAEGVNQLGLGLAFCKLAVESHGGTIHVEDNQPQGAVFSLFLPFLPLSISPEMR
jgi:two-component system sensor histidine kinase/response regulator